MQYNDYLPAKVENGKFKDLTGQTFGRLTVLKLVGRKLTSSGKNSSVFWLCRCECSTLVHVNTGGLTTGNTKSCGCLKKEKAQSVGRTHGMSKTPTYKTWAHMVERCTNPKSKDSKDYMERGITICDRWLNSFENFLEDMGERPNRKHSIERSNNDKGYSPENCVWALPKQQGRNKRNNFRIIYNGENLTLAEWSERLGIDRETLKSRIRAGWSAETAIETPVKRRRAA